MNDTLLNLVMGLVLVFTGVMLGATTYEQGLYDEIELYNSIRLNGIYYYPEEVINNVENKRTE